MSPSLQPPGARIGRAAFLRRQWQLAPPIRCRRCANRPCSDFSTRAANAARRDLALHQSAQPRRADFVDAPRKTRGDIEPHASLSLLGKTDRAASLLDGQRLSDYAFFDELINGIEISSIRDRETRS